MSACLRSDHWRKNIPILGLKCRTFAVDLLGYGYSDKPSPRYFPSPSQHACTLSAMKKPFQEMAEHMITEAIWSHRDLGVNKLYCFETWGRQLLDFAEDFVGGEPAFLICNSVGGACQSQSPSHHTTFEVVPRQPYGLDYSCLLQRYFRRAANHWSATYDEHFLWVLQA